MKRLIKSEKGAVSVFLIIVLSAIFLFNAVLIDYARIIVAKRQTENTVKTAVRSVLSAYDTKLQSKYALFGLGRKSEKDIFIDILEKNLTTSSGYFNLTSPLLEKDKISLNLDRSLADHRVIEQQILEEMKYKAPVDITLDVITDFQQLSQAMKQASDTTKTLIRIEKNYEKRQEYLEEVFELQQKSADLVGQRKYKDLTEINNIYSNYKSFSKDYINNSKKIIAAIYNDYSSILTIHNKNLTEAEQFISKAKKENEAIKKIINERKTNNAAPQNNQTGKGKNSLNSTDVNSLNETLDNLDNYEDLLIDDSYFTDLAKDVNEQKQLYSDLVNEIKRFEQVFAEAINIDENTDKNKINSYNQNLKEISKEIQQLNNTYREKFVTGNQIENRRKELNNMLSGLNKKEKKKYEETAKASLSTLTDLLKTIEKGKKANSDFKTLEQYYKEYLNYNNIDSGKHTDSLNNNPEETVTQAMDYMDKLYIIMADALEGMRNELYINEYSIAKFKYFNLENSDSQVKSKSGKQSDLIDKDKLLAALTINNQEVEYILYGYHTSGGNIAAAFRDIFLIRLAFNTMEGLIKYKNLGHPLLILAAAVAYGLAQSVIDLTAIIRGEEVPLLHFKFASVINLGYRDYLRLLLMFRGDEANKLTRIQALIQFNTGSNLKEIHTYVKGTATTSIKLWFLPGTIKALNLVGILDGDVEGQNYIISKTAVMAY